MAIAIHSASHSNTSQKEHFSKPDQTVAERNGKSCAEGQNLTRVQDTDGGTNGAVLYYI